ncbi:MAG TPA: hypothetical protein VK611_21545 [Acidimicrobiales bacterium]|nr:hypothetical protein [Acidimicrobiales bacterium]
MLPDLTRRITAVATSVVTLVTGLAVLFNAFVAEVTPSLPDGWQDNAAAIGAAVTSVLLIASRAVRRVTAVPTEERGLLPPPT